MKTSLATFAVALLTTPALFAAETIIKTCNTTVSNLEEVVSTTDMSIVITTNDLGETTAVTSTKTPNGVVDVQFKVEISEGQVREGLTADSDPDQLANEAERLITHAMSLSEDPIMEGRFSTGIELSKVRSAKIFTLGDRTKFGSAAVVEVRDANDVVLGSFLGGFLVSPCK